MRRWVSSCVRAALGASTAMGAAAPSSVDAAPSVPLAGASAVRACSARCRAVTAAVGFFLCDWVVQKAQGGRRQQPRRSDGALPPRPHVRLLRLELLQPRLLRLWLILVAVKPNAVVVVVVVATAATARPLAGRARPDRAPVPRRPPGGSSRAGPSL